MKFDATTIRLLGRITDRLDLIRKYPHRYEIDEADLAALQPHAQTLEAILSRVKTIKAG